MATKVHEETAQVAAGPASTNGTHADDVALLSADEILAADDVAFEVVHVPEWGGSVRVQTLTGEQRLKIGALMAAESKKTSEDEAAAVFDIRVVAASIVDAEGKRLFSQADVAKLAKKSNSAIRRIYRVAARLSGIGEAALEEAQDDLKETPSGNSGSD